MIAITSYFAAIVAANLIVTFLGRPGLFITATLLIPFDLFARDVLHVRWHGRLLRTRMFCLVFGGSLLSFIFNSKTLRVALASFLAFGLAGLIDFFFFQVFFDKGPRTRMHISNIFSSLADSSIFVSIVFGFLPGVIAFQWLLKFCGSAFWTEIYARGNHHAKNN